MSEEEKTKKPEDKAEDTQSQDIVDANVALIIAERDAAIDKLGKALDEIKTLKKKLKNAETIIEEDSKAALINDIAPRVNLPASTLALKSREELEAWKKVLDYSKPMTFKSSSPLQIEKDSPEHKLNTMFDRKMAQLKGGS